MDVLLTRTGRFAQRIDRLLAEHGHRTTAVELVRTSPIDDPGVRQALARLATGGADWLVVSSATTVALLPERITARIAAVGPATARALQARGHRVDLVAGRPGAKGLLEVWPDASGTVLWPTSTAAHDTLAEGLEQAGMSVTRVDCYRPEATMTDGDQVAAALAPHPVDGWDAVLVGSGTAAREVSRLGLTPQVVATGEQTAADARAAGLRVAAVAANPSPEGCARALLTATDTDRHRTAADQPRATPER